MLLSLFFQAWGKNQAVYLTAHLTQAVYFRSDHLGDSTRFKNLMAPLHSGRNSGLFP